jgi:hypothetical protein
MTDMSRGAGITTPFGFETTAADVIEGTNLSGKRAIVTGGSSGIGVETAARWQARASTSRSRSATQPPDSGPPPTSQPTPATRRSTLAASTSPTPLRSRTSSPPGTERSTLSSTTPA